MSYKEKEFLELLDKRGMENKTSASKWGSMTPMARVLASMMGVHPWKVLVPISIGVSLVIGATYGGGLVKLASLLQGMF